MFSDLLKRFGNLWSYSFFSYKKGKDDKKISRDEIYGILSSESKKLFTPLRISGFAQKFQQFKDTKNRSDSTILLISSLLFSLPTRSVEDKILIQFFDARSASGFCQVILFLAFYSSINLIEFSENVFCEVNFFEICRKMKIVVGMWVEKLKFKFSSIFIFCEKKIPWKKISLHGDSLERGSAPTLSQSNKLIIFRPTSSDSLAFNIWRSSLFLYFCFEKKNFSSFPTVLRRMKIRAHKSQRISDP